MVGTKGESEVEILADSIRKYNPDRPEYNSAFMTIAQAADVLGVGYGMVKKRARKGDISSFRVGRSVRIPFLSVAHYLAQGYSGDEDPALATAKYLLARIEVGSADIVIRRKPNDRVLR